MDTPQTPFQDAESVGRIAHLARLALAPTELERLGRQLGDILGHMQQLQSVDTAGVEPTVLANETRFRSDGLRIEVSEAERMLNAPDAAEGAFRVPKVL